MAILEITNRTENWKTARYFAPLFGYRSVWLARRLLLEKERARLEPGAVRLELFWRGMRDYFHQDEKKLEAEVGTLARTYSDLFPSLREEIETFGGFQELREGNYNVAPRDGPSRLASNLRNTEIDIVLESPNHLFVGEAKHLSRFGASGDDLLTHQLIRQYVMACILLKVSGEGRNVVPFVVGDSRGDLKKPLQVQFMLDKGWLREENILEWSDIEALW